MSEQTGARTNDGRTVTAERTDGLIERTLTRLRRIDSTSGTTAAVEARLPPAVPQQSTTEPVLIPEQIQQSVPAQQSDQTQRSAQPQQSEQLGQPAHAEPPRTLADLYAEHRMRLVRLALLLVDEPATAEDVVQEAFAGLHRHWSGLRDEYAALGYLRTAVVNGSRSVLRRRRTAREYVPPHQVTARSAESLALLSAEHQAVVEALGTLPGRQREVLVLRYYGGLSEAEISESTGISKGAVKSTASRALDAVAKSMSRR